MSNGKNNLSEQEKQQVLDLIKERQTVPKELLYKMVKDSEDVFLFWNGRNEAIENIVLPFHSIEHIDEPRKGTSSDTSLDLFAIDPRGRQLKGWTNKLIWGDNKLVLSSLAYGPLRDEIEKEGGIKLIYIDPPFAVGADFGINIEIDGEDVSKQQSVIEEIAYRDTWGKGISSYLSMMYERIKLMHELLAKNGSIYVHCDWRVNGFLRLMLDEIFGNLCFTNEVIWNYATGGASQSFFGRKHDTILYYRKNPDDYVFNFNEIKERRTEKSLQRAKNPKGARISTDNEFKLPTDVWSDINALNPMEQERLNYPTQKPEKLLAKMILASTNDGDIVLDCFCGSGTTIAASEKLGRKWIGADLGRFAIHTTRKRIIQVQRELKEKNEDFRAFEILTLGKYERKYFLDINNDLTEKEQKQQIDNKNEQYLQLILDGYKAKRITGFKTLHGQRADRFIHIGSIDFPVTKAVVDEILEECKKKIITKVDVLGFEFEMVLTPFIEQEMKEQGINLKLKNIPREIFDKRAVEKGQVKFYDVAYLEIEPVVKGKEVKVKLKDYVTHYTQDDMDAVVDNMRNNSDRVVIDDGKIVKIIKDNDKIKRDILTKKWSDWVDYWAVDFDYSSKKEIIKIKEGEKVQEKWTGNYIFENEWQSFRTRKDNEIVFASESYKYEKSGKYKIAVRVVDILGQDTLQVVEIKI